MDGTRAECKAADVIVMAEKELLSMAKRSPRAIRAVSRRGIHNGHPRHIIYNLYVFTIA